LPHYILDGFFRDSFPLIDRRDINRSHGQPPRKL
jgi:hypothetical protein